MLKPFAAFVLLATPLAAPVAQTPRPVAQWTLAGGNDGCAVHTSSQQGTVISVVAGAGQQNLIFLVQNPGWSLRDGARYEIAVAFDGGAPWQLQATGRTNIDSDGPGLIFALPAADEDREGDFLNEFVSARGMQLQREGEPLASMPLGTGRSAMTALAQCLGRVWSGQTPGETPNVTEAGLGGGNAIKI
jgi:hypothetical protein